MKLSSVRPRVGFLCACVAVACLAPRGLGQGAAPDPKTAAAQVFEGDFVLHRDIPVSMAAGTPEHPRLVEVKSLRIEAKYGNAWALAVGVNWSPAAEATWQIRLEVLDDKGRKLAHSRDKATVFTTAAANHDIDGMPHASLELDAMQWEARRHASRFRLCLEPAKEPPAGPTSDASVRHLLEIVARDGTNGAPVAHAAVVVQAIYAEAQRRSHTFLFRTDEQGKCTVSLRTVALAALSTSVQKDGYAAQQTHWSNPFSAAAAEVPLLDLPAQQVMEMVPARTIGGIVQDPNGRPVAGAEVSAEARSEEVGGVASLHRIVLTDKDGRWQIAGVPAEVDTVQLGFKHPDYAGDYWANRRIAGDELTALRDSRYVAVLRKGLVVSGRVLDEQGQPISRAAVVLAPACSWGFRYEYMYVLTDSAGRFRFGCARNDLTDAEPDGGSTGVLVEVPDYVSALQRVVVEPNLAPLEFRLKAGRPMTVRVTDPNGRALAEAWTVVHPLAEDPRYGLWLEDTDAQGRFQIPHAPDGEMRLTVGKSGYVTVRDYPVLFSDKERTVLMLPAPRVRGTVCDAQTGKAISRFVLAPAETNARALSAASLRQSQNGGFEMVFEESHPERLQLMVLALGYRPMTSDPIPLDGTRPVEFKLVPDPSFDEQALQRERGPQRREPRVVKGTVVDPNGRPAPNVTVASCGNYAPDTLTDAAGKFKLCYPSAERPRGNEATYILVRDRQRNLAAVVELEETAQELQVKLAPGTALAGRVTDVEGRGIPTAKMSLIFHAATVGYGLRETAQPDAEGRFEIRAVPQGRRYSVEGTAEGYGRESVEAQPMEGGGSRLELEPLVLRVANLTISGTVVDGNDKPVSGARIFCYGRGQPSHQLQTDGQGRFVIRGVCAGMVEMQANTMGQTNLYGRLQTEGGATDVKLVVGPRGSGGRFVPARPPSLLGKPLPSLVDLGIDLPADARESKGLLLCFFDMNQRPSRYCLTTLARQAEALRQKGVVVLGIQAADADEAALTRWVKEQALACTVAAIKGDKQKTGFSWGVRSLPWLILADRANKVVAEGFSVQELDACLTRITGP